MVINVQVINNTLPQLSVTIPNGGANPVTYAQVVASMGSYVYKAEGLYLYSDNANQLVSIIKYNRFDVNGMEKVTNIVTTIDPYQMEASLFKDLTPMGTSFILNGNSSFAFTVAAQTFMQLKLYCTRITNSFDGNLDNFKEMEVVANKPYFFDNYGDRSSSAAINKRVENLLPAENGGFNYGSMGDINIDGSALVEVDTVKGNENVAEVGQIGQQLGDGKREQVAQVMSVLKYEQPSAKDKTLLALSVVALSMGGFLLTKK